MTTARSPLGAPSTKLGGGIYASAADIIVDHCLIVDNEAISGANGGGIYLMNCPNALITYCEIARNSATGT